MIDATPDEPAFSKFFCDEFNELIDSAQKKYKDQEPPRDYLGGSRLGLNCERQLGFEYHKAEKDPDRGFAGRTYRIFDRGHDGEARASEYINRAGFDLQEEKPSGGQWGFQAARDPETGIYRLRGHADGKIVGGPELIGDITLTDKYPLLWENKMLKASRYNKLQKKGAREAEWEYFVQCQVYMAYLELEWCLFTAISADTMHIHAEIFKLDLAVAQDASDKGVRVVKSANPMELPRQTENQYDRRCMWCDYKQKCWERPELPPSNPVDVEHIVKNWV